MARTLREAPWFDAVLAWYFVTVWGSGFLATKVGLQHAAPFTFLTLRFAFGLACVVPIVLLMQPRLPAGRELGHVVVAGLLMHAVHLGGSHYTQYLGVSAGITALILSAQPLITALIAVRWMGETLAARQWAGVIIGLAGVALAALAVEAANGDDTVLLVLPADHLIRDQAAFAAAVGARLAFKPVVGSWLALLARSNLIRSASWHIR